MSRQIRRPEEQDVYTGWRKVLAWYSKSGRVKAVKKRTHRYDRRTAAKKEIREQQGE